MILNVRLFDIKWSKTVWTTYPRKEIPWFICQQCFFFAKTSLKAMRHFREGWFKASWYSRKQRYYSILVLMTLCHTVSTNLSIFIQSSHTSLHVHSVRGCYGNVILHLYTPPLFLLSAFLQVYRCYRQIPAAVGPVSLEIHSLKVLAFLCLECLMLLLLFSTLPTPDFSNTLNDPQQVWLLIPRHVWKVEAVLKHSKELSHVRCKTFLSYTPFKCYE